MTEYMPDREFTDFDCPGCGGFKSAHKSLCKNCFGTHGFFIAAWPKWLQWNVRDFDRQRYTEDQSAWREISLEEILSDDSDGHSLEIGADCVEGGTGNRHTHGRAEAVFDTGLFFDSLHRRPLEEEIEAKLDANTSWIKTLRCKVIRGLDGILYRGELRQKSGSGKWWMLVEDIDRGDGWKSERGLQLIAGKRAG